eukprot:CAMPEP_0169089002 /NCGR_PEP_ID=MMETSP1015-20121227/15052_1 /TAXON_ID=342587 /ORGANISM="Karlodinium micrum, Strain CCMP2283" /LENGTH=156 /DNA_ID=CAMNT_0009149309 /DNA_START=1 /DNA_END=469 /DNA_ORIENTATION=+
MLGFSQETLAEMLKVSPPADFDETQRCQTRWWLGFERPHSDNCFGSDDIAFGHSGAGGSFGFADPSAEVAFCYAMGVGNLWMTDPRQVALRQSVYEVVSQLGGPARPQPHEPRLKEWLKKPDDLYFRTNGDNGLPLSVFFVANSSSFERSASLISA